MTKQVTVCPYGGARTGGFVYPNRATYFIILWKEEKANQIREDIKHVLGDGNYRTYTDQ